MRLATRRQRGRPALRSHAVADTIHDHGSIILLRAASLVGRAWIEEHVSTEGYQPFTGGTLLCEPRYVADMGGRRGGRWPRRGVAVIPRHLIDQLVAALRLPPSYTGQIVVRLNVHRGTVGKTILAVEQEIKL